MSGPVRFADRSWRKGGRLVFGKASVHYRWSELVDRRWGYIAFSYRLELEPNASVGRDGCEQITVCVCDGRVSSHAIHRQPISHGAGRPHDPAGKDLVFRAAGGSVDIAQEKVGVAGQHIGFLAGRVLEGE